jgi:hypothetical protein
MRLKLYLFYVSILFGLLLQLQVVSALAGEVLYRDDFTNLAPSWGKLNERLSVKDGKLILQPAIKTTQSLLNQSYVFDDADINVEVIMPAGDQTCLAA